MPSSFASICDFDGDGTSELVIVQLRSDGKLDWLAVNPKNGQIKTIIKDFGDASSSLIPGNWLESNEAVAAIIHPAGSGSKNRARWEVAYPEHGETEIYTRNLGRQYDVVILGGDYDGNGITDSLILKQSTGKLGLRVNFFLSSYDANKLEKERLYRQLGKPFRDTNFFFSPAGSFDYLAVLRKGADGRVLSLRPFTDSPRKLFLGTLPGGTRGPLPLKQQTGQPDLLLFYRPVRTGTEILVKDLSGQTRVKFIVPARGTVTVGDYLPETGWEAAIVSGTKATMVNPLEGTQLAVDLPRGKFAPCVQTLQIG